MTILHIDSSILNEKSVSRQLTAAIVKRLNEIKPGTQVIHTDLAAEPVGHLSGPEFLAFQGVDPQDEAAKEAVAHNDKLLNDFLGADTIVIGAPMYNFSLPTQLRAWLDRLAVPGKTFSYTANGAVGLAVDKKVIVASSRGGVYSKGSPAVQLDHQETYLYGFLSFLGITDVTFIRAEGLALGEDSRRASLDAAISEINKFSI